LEINASEAPAAPIKPRNEFDERQPKSNQSTILIEGGEDFDEEEGGEEFDEENEPNFNRVEGAPVAAGQPVAAGSRPPANNNDRQRRRRRRGGRGPRPGGGQG
jgi:polyribonucleotide nucleotidyltransferase